MEYRSLGRSGLKISELTLGTMTFGGQGGFKNVGNTQVEDARRIVDRSIEAGVNLIDTANMYSGGESEKIVGEVIKGRRDDLLIASKVRFRMGPGPNDLGLSRHHIISACEASLQRLGIDHLDLYQVHEWDGQTPLEETLDALDTLIHQGKVRYVGCSNYSAWHLMKAMATAERLRLQPFVSQQIYYSMIGREAEYELVPASLDQNLGILVWSPLAGGLLSGKYRRDKEGPAGSRHTTSWSEPPIYNWDRVYDIIEGLVAVAEECHVSAAQVALAWLLGKPGITSIVIGARTEEQLTDNLAAVELTLSDEQRQRLDKLSVPDLLYPYWHQKGGASDRLSPADESLLNATR